MDSKELLEKYAEGTGWDMRTELALVCEFLDIYAQSLQDRFKLFLQDKHDRETMLEPWQHAVAAGETLESFEAWRHERRREKEGEG